MTRSPELRNAVNSLEDSLDQIKALYTSHSDRLWYLRKAERQLATIRAIVEAEMQAEIIERRYGTPRPKSIKDWWTK